MSGELRKDGYLVTRNPEDVSRIRTLEAENARLKEQLAEAQKDTQRLDLIDGLPWAFTVQIKVGEPKADSRPTFREWIDKNGGVLQKYGPPRGKGAGDELEADIARVRRDSRKRGGACGRVRSQ